MKNGKAGDFAPALLPGGHWLEHKGESQRDAQPSVWETWAPEPDQLSGPPAFPPGLLPAFLTCAWAPRSPELVTSCFKLSEFTEGGRSSMVAVRTGGDVEEETGHLLTE